MQILAIAIILTSIFVGLSADGSKSQKKKEKQSDIQSLGSSINVLEERLDTLERLHTDEDYQLWRRINKLK